MVDKLGRILISKELQESVKFEQKEVHVYYSEKKGRFFILPKKVEKQYWLCCRPLDDQSRFSLPKEILKVYGTKNVMLFKKEGIIYVIPLKKE